MSIRIKDLTRADVLVPWWNTDTALHLIGPPGCGKTSVVENEIPETISQALGHEIVVVTEMATTVDAPDVRGFLVPAKDENGKGISYFTRPGLMPTEEFLKKHPHGIYLIDERSQGQLLTQTALAPVVLDKKFGEHQLPEGWRVVSASNRLSDKSAVVRPPMHLINRETILEIDFDVDSATQWWEKHGMHPMGIAFAKAQPGVFATEVPSEPKPYCTARSFTMAWDFLNEVAGTDEDGNPNMKFETGHVIQEFTAGYVGEGVSGQMFGFLKVADQLPTIQQILKDPKKAKCPDRLDAGYAAVQLCIHHADPKNVDRLWEYAERLPIELQTTTARSLLEKSGGVLLNSKALGDWVAKNHALIINTTA
jgi:hypothetical protein